MLKNAIKKADFMHKICLRCQKYAFKTVFANTPLTKRRKAPPIPYRLVVDWQVIINVLYPE